MEKKSMLAYVLWHVWTTCNERLSLRERRGVRKLFIGRLTWRWQLTGRLRVGEWRQVMLSCGSRGNVDRLRQNRGKWNWTSKVRCRLTSQAVGFHHEEWSWTTIVRGLLRSMRNVAGRLRWLLRSVLKKCSRGWDTTALRGVTARVRNFPNHKSWIEGDPLTVVSTIFQY